MLLSMTACTEREEAANPEETVSVRFRIGTVLPGTSAATAEEMAVNSLQIMVFDAQDSTIVDYKSIDDLSQPPSLRIEKNRARIVYAAANIPDDFSDVSSIADLHSRTVSYRNEAVGNFQMMGHVNVCVTSDVTVSLPLRRFVAKITLHGYRIRLSCLRNSVPDMKRVALLAIPKACYCDFSEYTGSYYNLFEGMTEENMPTAEIKNPPDHIDEYGFLINEQSLVFYGYPNSVQTYGNNKYPRVALVCIGEYHNSGSSVSRYCYHLLGLSLPPLESNLEYRILQVTSAAYGEEIEITPGEHPVSEGDWKPRLSNAVLGYIEVRDMSTGLIREIYPIKEVSYREEDIE